MRCLTVSRTGTLSAQLEVVGRPPAGVGLVDVEAEGVDGEAALEVRELGERPVERLVVEVVGDGDVRVVGEVQVDGQRPSSYGGSADSSAQPSGLSSLVSPAASMRRSCHGPRHRHPANGTGPAG